MRTGGGVEDNELGWVGLGGRQDDGRKGVR